MKNYKVTIYADGQDGGDIELRIQAKTKKQARKKALKILYADPYENEEIGLLCVENECEKGQTAESEFCINHET